MATDHRALGPTFASPTMAARAALVRALALLESTERAEARADAAEVQRLARAADDTIQAASRALSETWARATLLEATGAEPETEAEARMAWGDR